MLSVDMWHTLDSIHTHKVVAGPEEAGCSVGLGCIQEVVGDGHKGDLPAVQVLVQNLEEKCKGHLHIFVCTYLVRYTYVHSTCYLVLQYDTTLHAQCCMVTTVLFYCTLHQCPDMVWVAIKLTFSDSWPSSGSPASSMNTTEGRWTRRMTMGKQKTTKNETVSITNISY